MSMIAMRYPIFFCLTGVLSLTIIFGADKPVDAHRSERGKQDASAITRSINGPSSVVSDTAGGFHVAAADDNRIYHVSADGRLRPVAGSGQSGYRGDGGKADFARLTYPQSVALDSTGNLYIADSGNYRVRKVTPAGIINTVAGDGKWGDSGDGGPAVSARFGVSSIALDSAGNVYIADTNHYRIRKVASSGIISTAAGNGTMGFSGDAGPAAAAQLAYPEDVAVDTVGNLYIADSDYSCICKITPAGIITTVAGH